MTWSFDRLDHKIYKRNPLVSTDVEIRFHPILKIGGLAELSQFQEIVRSKFPKYQQQHVRNISFSDNGELGLQEDTRFVFSTADNQNSISLAQQSFLCGSKSHYSRDEMIENVLFGLAALERCFGSYNPTRLGVRYVNIIDKRKIESDLNQHSINWKDLISSEFIRLPHEIADESNTNFVSKIRSGMRDGRGEMTLQYGLVQNQNADHYRFDLDRFVMLSGEPVDIKSNLMDFTLDIYSLFSKLIGPKLKQWMDV